MSGMTDPGDKSPAEIEREVEQTRRSVSSTLDELRSKLKPSEMVDEVVGEAMGWVKGSGGTEFARNLAVTMRDNPLPVLLIGAGLAWLMLGGRGGSRPAYASEMEVWDDDYDRARQPYGQARTGYREAPSTNSSAGFVSRNLNDARDAASSAASAVSDAASRAASAVSGAASSVLDAGREQAAMVGDRAWRQARDAEPFLYGALGLALGAGIGAMLPITDAENRLMGEHRDEAVRLARGSLDTVRHVAEEKLAEAKDTLVETYEGTMERLDREGLANAPRILGDAATEVGMAAQETVRSAVDETKRGLGAG